MAWSDIFHPFPCVIPGQVRQQKDISQNSVMQEALASPHDNKTWDMSTDIFMDRRSCFENCEFPCRPIFFLYFTEPYARKLLLCPVFANPFRFMGTIYHWFREKASSCTEKYLFLSPSASEHLFSYFSPLYSDEKRKSAAGFYFLERILSRSRR